MAVFQYLFGATRTTTLKALTIVTTSLPSSLTFYFLNDNLRMIVWRILWCVRELLTKVILIEPLASSVMTNSCEASICVYNRTAHLFSTMRLEESNWV